MLGKVACTEQVLRRGSLTVRPLAELLGLRAGGLTRRVQAALVDFGAEKSFSEAAATLHRHHRVSLSASTVRTHTLKHARGMRLESGAHTAGGALPPGGAGDIVAEIDGTMLPVVFTEPGKDGNARKHRSCQWKETRLGAARAKGKAQSFFAVGGAEVEQAGQAWARAVALAGWGTRTRIHGVGDGAAWIYLQYQQMFGTCPGGYLLDFYHVCEYLAAAGTGGAATHPRWLEVQKKRLLEGRPERVLAALEPYLESRATDSEDAPVRAAHRYLSNRIDQLDYPTAIEKELPIGSGLIEGGHRHVLQHRLKISGAWWKSDNLRDMAHLRVCRANLQEDQYWSNQRKAA